MELEEIAQFAKDFGYQDVFESLNEKGYAGDRDLIVTEDKVIELIIAELTLIQKWLRDKHKIFVSICFYAPDTNMFDFRIDSYTHNIFYQHSIGKYGTYEKALLEGIKEATKLI